MFLSSLKSRLIICILGDFSCICFHLLIFFKIYPFDFFMNIRAKVSNTLDPDQYQQNPDQVRYSVGADLGLNCLQRLSAEYKKIK